MSFFFATKTIFFLFAINPYFFQSAAIVKNKFSFLGAKADTFQEIEKSYKDVLFKDD